MDTVSSVLIIAAIVIGLFLILKILTKPIKLIFKLLIHAASGFVLLWIVNFFGAGIASTFIHCVIAGGLGIPGVIILFLFC